MKLTNLICLSLIVTTALCGNSLSKFEGRPFQRKPPSGLFLLDGLGLDSLTDGQQIVAYGDVDNDKYTDIMTLNDDQTVLTVSLYSHQNFGFSNNSILVPGDKIVDVSTGDFNFDGKLDLLITTQNTETQKLQVKYYFKTDKYPYYGAKSHTIDLTDENHPFVLDSNGNRHLDVMYVRSSENEAPVRTLETFENEGFKSHPFSSVVSPVGNGCKDYAQVASNKFSTPHFNTFADINGDCAADLLITSTDGKKNYLEFYLRNPKDTLFCLVDVIELSDDVSSISIADMSNDGKLDLVIVTENDKSPLTINVIYNQFPSDSEFPCTAVDGNMTNPFKTEAFSAVTNTTKVNQIFTLPASYPVGTKLFTKDADHRPGRVRVGDINIDGYPDLLFIVQTPAAEGETRDDSYGNIVLVINQENTFVFNIGAGNGLKKEYTGYFTILKEEDPEDTVNNLDLLKIPATSVSFFDFHEKGKLGLWITNKTKDTKTTLMGAFNYVTSEHFILKTLGLNGAKPSSKEKINEVIGGLYYGASIECTVTKVDGKNYLAKAAQLPQSGYTSLDIPYMFLGLGRTNNYIEKFFMGITKKDDGKDAVQQQSWPTIIPNSQLIVNPLKNSAWTLDIYVNPTSEAFLISLVTGIILLILGIIIIYLHRQEKAEDIANQDRMIHIFG